MNGYIITAIMDYKTVDVYGMFDTYEEAEAVLENPALDELYEVGEVVLNIQQISPLQDFERDFHE